MSEKTVASISLAFGARCELEKQVKQCTTKQGCGKYLPITDFKSRNRKRVDGTFRLEIYARCKPCEKAFQSTKSRAYRSRYSSKRKQFKHVGPEGIDRVYFCELPPVEYSRELREERRGV